MFSRSLVFLLLEAGDMVVPSTDKTNPWVFENGDTHKIVVDEELFKQLVHQQKVADNPFLLGVVSYSPLARLNSMRRR